jgi:hypothetical protein
MQVAGYGGTRHQDVTILCSRGVQPPNLLGSLAAFRHQMMLLEACAGAPGPPPTRRVRRRASNPLVALLTPTSGSLAGTGAGL